MNHNPSPGDLTDPDFLVKEQPGSVKNVSKVKPLYDRIMVRRINALTKTKGGIIIPDTAKVKPIEGIVVSVGHGKYVQGMQGLQPLIIKEGDHVLFGALSGSEVIVNEVEMLILREEEILSIVKQVEDHPTTALMVMAAKMTDREATEALKAISELLRAIPQRTEHNLPT